MNIFADNAERYWAKNIPVIPLKMMHKAPAVARWQTYADMMPTEEERNIWLRAFPNGNIGLVLGPTAGVVAIDIDNEDEKLIEAISRVVPISPWVRIGRKGAVMLYRWEGQRTFNIQKTDTREMLVQCLSKGTQIAIPPSIHPDTKLPYTSNVELLDVIDVLPSLDRELEKRLRESINDAGFECGKSGNTKVSMFVPAGARDNQMVAHAGILARAVWRGERTLLEALGEIAHWVENFTEKVAGDDVSVEKAQQKLIEFLVRDVTGEKNIQLPIGWDEGLTIEDKEKLGLGFTADNEVWDYDKVRTFLLESYEKHPEIGSSGWMAATEVALSKIARNREFGSLNRDRMVRFISEQSATQLTKGNLNKRIYELERNERAGLDHSEIAGYVIEDISKFGELRFHADRFWQWKGACWEIVPDILFRKHIAEEYGAYPAAKKAGDHTGIVRVMSVLLARGLGGVKVKGLNFANGFLDEALVLHPHNPDFGCEYVLPYRYLPERAGHCPQFMQYLHDCWGEDADFVDKVEALQEAMAATMFGVGVDYQRCICLYGEGKTGKTRMVEIMKGLLPDNCSSSVPPQDWDDKFLPTELYGRLLNVAGELSENKLIAGDRFKQIIEGSTISGQRKNGPIFQFNPVATHWFPSNHLPRTRDSSDGFVRRWLFLKFNHPVSEEKKVIDLDQVILAAEREEIAAWAAQGIMRLKMNNGYTLPASHLVLIDQIANDNNSVRYFLTNSNIVKRKEGLFITETKLFNAYYTFCLTTQSANPVNQRTFHRMMQALQSAFRFRQVVNEVGLAQYEGIGL